MAEHRFAKRAEQQRDAAILLSLLGRFSVHGCFDTSLDHVAADVGVGKGTLYRHYRSREDLFDAALRAGIDALTSRSRDIWAAHASDVDAAFRAQITDLVALNHTGDPLSPSALARLSCGCRWLKRGQPANGTLIEALTPVVHEWQASGLLERTADSNWIASVALALVNSLAATRHGNEESVLPQDGAGPRRPAHGAEIATRIVDVLRRSFGPAAQPSPATAMP